MDKYTILVCDDEKDLVSGLKIYLEVENYRVLEAYNGMQALDILKKEEVHLVLMDVMMPGISGIETVIKMRSMGIDVPVILLTAKSEDSDKILGLNCGADDYITKPYNTGEVQARVRSQLRRYKGEFRKDTDECLRIKDIELNRKTKLVTVAGEEIQLTHTEFKILHLLMSHPGELFSLSDIYKKVWNGDAYGAENTVAVHIRHLREKIEFDPAQPKYIKVKWGEGYKIDKEQDA